MTPPGGYEDLRGLRILMVEDDIVIAMLLELLLQDLGCELVGPASTVPGALALLAGEKPDAATLDVNLGNEQVYPVADALKQAGIPFVFVTGYGGEGLAEAYRSQPTIKKPIDARTFGDELAMGLKRAAAQCRSAG